MSDTMEGENIDVAKAVIPEEEMAAVADVVDSVILMDNKGNEERVVEQESSCSVLETVDGEEVYGVASPVFRKVSESLLTGEYSVVLLSSYIWSLPTRLTTCSSIVGAEDLQEIRELYDTPSSYEVRAPSSNDRVFTNREGEMFSM